MVNFILEYLISEILVHYDFFEDSFKKGYNFSCNNGTKIATDIM